MNLRTIFCVTCFVIVDVRAYDRSGPPKRCGYIYELEGFQGKRHTLYDASIDPSNGIGNLYLSRTGNDKVSSMKPLQGNY